MANSSFRKGFVTTLGVLVGIIFFFLVVGVGCAVLIANVGP